MDSFYGGQPGKPFIISQIFRNKLELVSDLQQRWISPIMPGEYVIISYGSYTSWDQSDASKNQYQENYDKDYPVYGRSYNGTLWEKIYYEPTEEDIQDLIDGGHHNVSNDPGGTGFENVTDVEGVTYLMSGNETIFYSEDYGLGYKLITALTGNTPIISVDDTIILGPLEDPNVTINTNDVNNPELQFSLPRAVRFFFGDQLGSSTTPEVDKDYTIASNLMPAGMEVGDYFINKNTGYVFLFRESTGQNYTMQFKACFQPPAPESSHTIGPAYYRDENNDWQRNYPRITFEKIVNGWRANIISPQNPNLVIGPVSFCGSLEDGNVTGEIINENDYQLNMLLPAGSKHFAGNQVYGTGSISGVIIDGAKPGDIYVNTDFSSDSNGFVYQLQLDSTWLYLGSIKGATGDALKIKSTYTITPNEVPNDTLEEVGAYLTQQGEELEPDELVVVNYIDDNGEDTGYWYYQLEGQWYRVRVTSGLYSVLKDEYVPDSDEGYIYSTKYVNSLIVGEGQANDPERNTYNINTINKLISEATIQWDDFW